jgi:hypothetical protein
MAFVAIKLLKLGFSQAKKHRAKNQAQQFQDPASYPQYPQPYPMTEYPPGVAPGSNIAYTPETSEQVSKRSKAMNMLISALRFFQFVFGLAVVGLYGQDVHHDHTAKDTWNAEWVFALIVGFLATSTAAIHMIVPFLTKKVSYRPGAKMQLPLFAWEFVLCVLWLTLFGIFGKLYIGIYPSGSSDGDSSKRDTSSSSTSALGDASKINRMRHAVWVDLVNLVFWAVTASWALLKWLKARRAENPIVFDAEKEGGSI